MVGSLSLFATTNWTRSTTLTKASNRLNETSSEPSWAGPIKKNRTFLFGDYQGSRLRASNPFLSTVPTAAERGGDFTDRLTGQTFSPCATPSPADTFDTGTIFNPYSTNPNYQCADGSVVSLRTPISYNGQVNVIPPQGTLPLGINSGGPEHCELLSSAHRSHGAYE